MNQILQPGQIVQTEKSCLPCEVGPFLGGGGQGEVYQVCLEGKPLALKWYFPASATPAQRDLLENLVRKGAPSDRFLWPIELASAPGIPGFGYLMALRETRFKGIVDLMTMQEVIYSDDPDVVCPYCGFFSNHIHKFDPNAVLIWSQDEARMERERQLERKS